MEMHQTGDHQAPGRGVSSGWIQCHFPSPREMQPLSDLQLDGSSPAALPRCLSPQSVKTPLEAYFQRKQ